ncbi:uncharacterized protein LOC115999000 isoform X1 [Ipomoea triloba]|uniref:uncharacterized protein LOC115999000 isoform X1 n=2 Tax=Ipomoea triloba TaxID=35885 RepID=UPI00125CEE29|nr:uncharacterized protein LOC115999000 isoform X1 [Ipomoea triloba]
MVGERGIGDDSPMINGSEPEAERGTAEIEERLELSQEKVRGFEHPREINEKDDGHVVIGDVQKTLDHNATAGASGDTAASFGKPNREGSFKMGGKENLGCAVKMKRFGFDVNVADVSSSVNADPSYHCKSIGKVKSVDDFECASSVGPLEERAPLRAWSETKKNGSLAYSRGVPKPCVRKIKNERMKKRIELAKKEQADKFAKVAAPTGLLNGLNPGIINHVRNGRQVYSILESLVRSEKPNNCPAGEKHGNQMKSGERKDLENISCYSALPNDSDRNGKSYMLETRVFERTNYHLNSMTHGNDGVNASKLPSDTNIMSSDASDSVTALSIKAANVASQWLELLNQDTKGRLAALRSSRKRVREVIQTKFPGLISREFSCNPQDSGVGQFEQATASAHHARWIAMFDQMEKTLSEEESQLVSWRKQVQEMQLQCEWGLSKYNTPYGSPQPSALHNDDRSETDPERDLAVRAAAASIYSTCNFLSSTENLPCC